MWKYFGPNFRCYNYSDSVATDMNFLKFTVDMNFSVPVLAAVKLWKIDINVVDTYDGKTLMDFLLKRIEYVKNSPPVDHVRVSELQRLYDLLRKNGGKHAHEL
ncbi:hypothetical protein FEDK69T_02400 [Flavobacterium enshiense DK69]|nr:hypothetical protein FEDK69T_02400 [Flavobacterium enshiense DK69]